MSVGAGSIKRAAKAASTNVDVTEEKVVAKAETTVKAAEKEAAAPKAKKPAAKKTTVKKPAVKKEAAKPAAPKAVKKSNYNSDYEAYGVGQQLPIHLM